MADEILNQTGANSQNADAASPSAEAQVEAPNSPTGEIPGGAKAPENKVPQTRFNEVIHERNRERELREQYEARIRELESQRSMGAPGKDAVVEAEVQRLVKTLDMSEEAARGIVETNRNLLRAEREQMAREQNRNELSQWAVRKAQADPMYKELDPELDRAFSSLPPQRQMKIANDPDLLDMFYENVKASVLLSKSKQSFEKGASQAYETKGAKQAVTSMPGGSSSVGKTALSRESLRKMSPEEYKRRLPEINEALIKGLIR